MLIADLIILVNYKVSNYLKSEAWGRRKIKREIRLLTPSQKAILREFFIQERYLVKMPVNDPDVASLIERGLLESGSFQDNKTVGIINYVGISYYAKELLGLKSIGLDEGIVTKAIWESRLYIPPGLDVAEDDPIIITEGEKKTLKLMQEGFPALGIGGVWNWLTKGDDEESRPIGDLDLVNWRRPVTIVFDSDGYNNPLVRLAAFRLARELSHRGAKAPILFIPTLEAHP